MSLPFCVWALFSPSRLEWILISDVGSAKSFADNWIGSNDCKRGSIFCGMIHWGPTLLLQFFGDFQSHFAWCVLCVWCWGLRRPRRDQCLQTDLHARFSQTIWSRPFLDYEQKQTPASFASLHRGRKVAPQSGHGFSAKPGWNLYEDNPKNVSCQMSVLVSTCRWVMCLIWNISACRMSVWASVFVVLKSNLSWLLSVTLCLNLVQMCINLNMAPPWTDDKT